MCGQSLEHRGQKRPYPTWQESALHQALGPETPWEHPAEDATAEEKHRAATPLAGKEGVRIRLP